MQTEKTRVMFNQYKADHNNAVLLFKIGDYLEAYYEDADLLQTAFGKYRIKADCCKTYINILKALRDDVHIIREDC